MSVSTAASLAAVFLALVALAAVIAGTLGRPTFSLLTGDGRRRAAIRKDELLFTPPSHRSDNFTSVGREADGR